MALLDKWCWILKEERHSLWHRVLSSRYGEKGGNIREDAEGGSIWLNNLTSIKNGVGTGVGIWIDDNCRRELGDGESTLS